MKLFRVGVLPLVGVCSMVGVTLLARPAPAQTYPDDAYALFAEVSDAYILSVDSQTQGKYHENGNYDPDVLQRLQTSRNAAVRRMVPIALDIDGLRFRNDLEIIDGKVYEKVPGSRARRPKRDFDPMVERALPGLRLPLRGQEVRLAIAALRNSPNSGDIFEAGIKGEMMTQINGILETGLRRRMRDEAEQWGESKRGAEGTLAVYQDKSEQAVPTITNNGGKTLHHCIIISRIQPNAAALGMLAGAVQRVDEQARSVFSNRVVDIAQASATLTLLDSLQERGNLFYVPELAPGASIRLSASNIRLAQSMTVSLFSDEIKVRENQINLRAPAPPSLYAGRYGRGNGSFQGNAGLRGRTQTRTSVGSGKPFTGGTQSGQESIARGGGRAQAGENLGSSTPLHSGSAGGGIQSEAGKSLPIAVNKPWTYNIFIGDTADDTLAANGASYSEAVFKAKYNLNAKYFPAKAEGDICAYISGLPRNSKINLIGHSYGGETAAHIASHFAERCGSRATLGVLVTADPVSDKRPNYADIQHNVSFWVDIVAFPDDLNEADRLVWDKCRWGTGAQADKTRFGMNIVAQHLHHMDLEAMMNCKYKGRDGKQTSALEILLSPEY